MTLPPLMGFRDSPFSPFLAKMLGKIEKVRAAHAKDAEKKEEARYRELRAERLAALQQQGQLVY